MTYVFVPWRSREEVWTAVFPKRTLCVLPVAGRFFIEHQLDWAASCGATRVIVLDYGYSDILANMLTGGERHRWPFELIYDRFAPLADELVVRRWCEASYGGESPDRIIAGPMFPYKGELREIVTVSDYADINFKVLSEPGDRTLAGYSSEVGVQLGMNVVIKTGREIVRPISLGDNVLVDFGCRLLGRVIVDHNSILDRESVLEDSIVLSYTYVGRKMESFWLEGNRNRWS